MGRFFTAKLGQYALVLLVALSLNFMLTRGLFAGH